MTCRKLKNRVAAQTARDRKKAHMDGLEERLKALEEKSKRLLQENHQIRHQNSLLLEENKELKKRLGMDESEIKATQVGFHLK